MNTILKTKRGMITRIFYGVTLTPEQREVAIRDMERRESELSYEDRAARIEAQRREDQAGFREQQRFGERKPGRNLFDPPAAVDAE